MTHLRRSAFAIGGLAALTLALSGCGELVVLNPGSVATCPSDTRPVVLETSQDASGEQLEIHYEGPSELAVVFTYGYSVEDIPEAAATGAYAYSQSSSASAPPGDTAYLLRLDPASDAGWVSSDNAGVLTATFTGTIDELLDGRNAYLELSQGTIIAEVASAFVAVSCDTALTSGEVETVASDPALAPDLLLAAPLNPDTVRIGPFDIISQSTVDGVTTGTLRFAAGTAALFGDFVPSDVAEATLVVDAADVPNDTFSQLWFQEYVRDAETVGTFEITSPLTLTGDMTFEVRSDIAPDPLPAGPHILRIVFGNTDLVYPTAGLVSVSSELSTDQARAVDADEFAPAAAGDAKAVFFTLEYDPITGILIDAAIPLDAAQPELADTGAAPFEAAALFAGILLSIGIALVLVRRRRLPQQ
ncbi:hypothetical protein [Microcella sp.]|uniref:hypothetical protein n=1 Tax=Microcella sp. TaxID=1913979 RepID=UPI00299F8223|nr:hypothetical protein [Microcella sp.]MDX2026858.1 hypothetical protein [Microcella sp.]